MQDDTTNTNQPADVTAGSTQKKADNKAKFGLPVVLGAILLLGGGAAAYNASIQNQPENIWKNSLSTTARGLESFVETVQDEQSKGGTFNGSFDIKSPVAADGTVSGSWYESNVQAEGEFAASGVRVNGELRAIASEGGETPDIYVKVDGLNGIDALVGLSNPEIGDLISEVNGSWYVIDRTLLDQVGLELDSEQDSDNSVDLSPNALNDIAEKTSKVLVDRLFTDDAEKGVLKLEESLGKEQFDGDDTHKFKVSVRKEQFKALIVELKDSLKDTEAQDALLQMSPGADTIEEALNFDDLLESIDEADFADAQAEVWVDADTKLMRNIRITPTDLEEGQKGYIDFGLNYDGGDELPFTITVQSSDASGDNDATIILSMIFNQETKAVTLGFDVDGVMDGDTITATGSMTLSPSNDAVSIEKPEGAKNIIELIGGLLGGSSFPTGLGTDFDDLDSFPLDDVEL